MRCVSLCRATFHKNLLKEHGSELEWRMLPLMPHCERSEVASGAVAIIESGDKTLHPIERQFVRPEVHSLMQVDRPLVSPEQTDRVVLWVNQPLDEIKGTYAEQLHSLGCKAEVLLEKIQVEFCCPSGPPVEARDPWYDLTGLAPGIGFWTKSSSIVTSSQPTRIDLNSNCNLYDIHFLLQQAPKQHVP